MHPGLGHRRKQLQELRFRVVGAAEERAPVGGQEAGHRPAALPGQRDGGVHVDRVEVRPLFAVDLDADEVGVHRRGDVVVLEGFVRHHVAPVARRVPDGQQDRHIAPRRLGERLRRPLPPVHRVVGVLAQVRAGGRTKAVGHPGSLVRTNRELPGSSMLDGPLVEGLVRLGMLGVERLRQLAQMPVHRPHQENVAISSSSTMTRPNGLALPKSGPVLRGASSASRQRHPHGGHRSIPVNRSVSGSDTGTRDRANSYSSVGHSRCCHSIGAAKKSPFGSIWVACARSASSRCLKYCRAFDARGHPVGEQVVVGIPVLEPLVERADAARAWRTRPAASASAAAGSRGCSTAWTRSTARRRRGTADSRRPPRRPPPKPGGSGCDRDAGSRRSRRRWSSRAAGTRGSPGPAARWAPRAEPARSSPRAAAAAGHPRAARNRRNPARGVRRRGSRRPWPSRRGGPR